MTNPPEPTEMPDHVKSGLKSLFKETMEEFIAEQKEKETNNPPTPETPAPKRTEKPKSSAWSSLFGG